jgi:hypothetical protein
VSDTYSVYLNGKRIRESMSTLREAVSAAKLMVLTCHTPFSTAVVVNNSIARIERVIIDDANGCRSFDPNETTAADTLPLSPPTAAGVVCRCHERTGFCPAHGPTGPDPEMQV